MRQLPLYALTVLVAFGLVYAFVAPFHGGLETTTIANQGADVTAESFELPDEMKNDAPAETPDDNESVVTAPSAEARQVDPFPLSNKTAPLERVEPRQPLSAMGQAGPPAPPAPPPDPVPVDNTARPVLLYRPVATAAGTIEASGYEIALEGIEVIPPEETCNVDGGAAWPCGMAARTAFRNWLRSRAVECNVPGQQTSELIATQCKLGRTDLAEWLVENGWARARDGTPMVEAMKKAQEARLGIFGSPPPALPVTNDLPLPSFSDVTSAPSEPAPAPPPLAVPDAPFPPRPQ
jgi:endonuclease YncB( thermonuclease family)